MSGWTDEERRLADRFRELGFSFDIWSDPPGRAWRGFVHSTDELVVLLEGELTMNSEVGQGSSFRLELPIAGSADGQ